MQSIDKNRGMIQEEPVLRFEDETPSTWREVSKRIFDLTVALTAFVLLFPVMMATGITILLTMGSPVFFRQRRPGRFGSPIVVVKFCTMSNRRDANGELLPDAERLTRVGKFLRASSLDELPQLWNVIAGELSLVGPRPLLMEYLPLYSREQARRHEVLPGITGWAQVKGRNAITWEQKLALDVWYVEHHGFWLDLHILWLTVAKVLSRDGISKAGHATMPRFNGSNNASAN